MIDYVYMKLVFFENKDINKNYSFYGFLVEGQKQQKIRIYKKQNKDGKVYYTCAFDLFNNKWIDCKDNKNIDNNKI